MGLQEHLISILLSYLFLGPQTPVPEFAQLCGHLLGPYWEYIASIFSMLAVLGAAIVYWVLMSNFLYNSIDYCIGKLITKMRQNMGVIHKP